VHNLDSQKLPVPKRGLNLFDIAYGTPSWLATGYLICTPSISLNVAINEQSSVSTGERGKGHVYFSFFRSFSENIWRRQSFLCGPFRNADLCSDYKMSKILLCVNYYANVIIFILAYLFIIAIQKTRLFRNSWNNDVCNKYYCTLCATCGLKKHHHNYWR
jgi:hypothetical protein